MSKPLCKFGALCYQTNPKHLAKYTHPKTACKKGDGCKDTSTAHLARYSHPEETTPASDILMKEEKKEEPEEEEEKELVVPVGKQACKFGKYCFRTAKDHRREFVHPTVSVTTLLDK